MCESVSKNIKVNTRKGRHKEWFNRRDDNESWSYYAIE